MPAPRKRKAVAARQDAPQPIECSSPPCYLTELGADYVGVADPGIYTKRIYEPANPADGYRVLVDRLWPRGVRKGQAALDHWARELAPSTRLREWLHEDMERWSEFCRRYRLELRTQSASLNALRKHAAERRVTLLYAAKDAQRNHAKVLREVLAAPLGINPRY